MSNQLSDFFKFEFLFFVINKSQDNIRIISHTKNITDYPQNIYELLYKIEPNNFWFWGRNRIILTYINHFLRNKEESRLLEIGCGTGFALSFLEKAGFHISGLDISLNGLKFARKRSKKADLICADITKDKLNIKFDSVCLFDVLEHIPNDILFLRSCSKLIKQNGLIFITVPADMKIWSKVDEISGHKRRYDREKIIYLLKICGFTIEKISYFNFFLYFPELLSRKFHQKYSDSKNTDIVSVLSGLFNIPKIFNTILKIPLFLESVLLKYLSFNMGGSIIVAARKK